MLTTTISNPVGSKVAPFELFWRYSQRKSVHTYRLYNLFWSNHLDSARHTEDMAIGTVVSRSVSLLTLQCRVDDGRRTNLEQQLVVLGSTNCTEGEASPTEQATSKRNDILLGTNSKWFSSLPCSLLLRTRSCLGERRWHEDNDIPPRQPGFGVALLNSL